MAKKGLPLTQAALSAHAGSIGIGLPVIWAVLTVETSGCGFLGDRRPKILFERHVFHRETKGKFDTKAPDLSSSSAGGYGPAGANQHARLARAMALDKIAALDSTSWGLGQVMGFNAKTAGFQNVTTMVAAMETSEDAQLGAMIAFLKAGKLHTLLQSGDWAGFAKRYNGAAFAKNKYDVKLAAAFKQFVKDGVPDIEMRTAQLALVYAGFNPGRVDGIFGSLTSTALQRFQLSEKLPQTGQLDSATKARLTNLL
jgi:hypothetical protein